MEVDGGFCVYELHPEHCYIEDIFVSKEFRRKGLATVLANEVTELAKNHGCKRLFGSVVPSAKGAQESLLTLLSYGFRIHEARPDLVFFVKEI